jgi:outer membrane receptor protein involved in Fe transport
VGSADDPGTTITYYDYPAALAGQQFEQRTWANPPGQEQTFKSFELAGSKRFSRGWQLMASYSATKSDSPFPEEAELNPNTEINTADQTWEWNGKGSVTYVFPMDISVSTRYEHRSGAAQARQHLFRGGRQIPSIVLNVEPIGSIRLPNIDLVDFRVEKNFQLIRNHSVRVWFNIYNLLNANTVTSRSVRAGSNYLRPTGILPPRIAEFSAQYRF